jgi:hypothetical protein
MARVYVYPQCNDIVAHQQGVIDFVNHLANEKAAVARGTLMAHRAEGHSEITVTTGDVDSFVNLEDKPSESNSGMPAAAAIEYGNRYGGGGVGALRGAFGL